MEGLGEMSLRVAAAEPALPPIPEPAADDVDADDRPYFPRDERFPSLLTFCSKIVVTFLLAHELGHAFWNGSATERQTFEQEVLDSIKHQIRSGHRFGCMPTEDGEGRAFAALNSAKAMLIDISDPT